MLEKFITQQNKTKSIKNDTERLNYGTCVLRSLLQAAAITSLEILVEKTPFPEYNKQIVALISRFSNPPDSLPIEILDASTPIIRSFVSNSFNIGWYKGDNAPSQNLVSRLQEWLTFRNSKIAHGVLGTEDAKEWAPKTLDIIEHLLQCFGAHLPRIEEGKLLTTIDSTLIPITTPIIYEEHLVIIKKAIKRKGIWQLLVQTLDKERPLERTIDLLENSIFEKINSDSDEKFSIREASFNGKPTSIYNNIPTRQTDIFIGRSKEIGELTEWINDKDEAKYCLIYGDGGIGKTTLALEFLNRVLDGEISFTSQPPTIICYYSAKTTQWTEKGLRVLRGLNQAMEQCAREVMYCFNKVLPSDLFGKTGIDLVNKVASELQKHDIQKGDVIFVIDNTETLSTSNTETEDFVRFVRQIGKSIGKVLMTSRRRELLEFKPILVSPMSEADSKALLRRLAEKYNATAIKQAGDASLRKVSERLGHKPMLIDVLVKHISRTNTSIEAAICNILRKDSTELLDFLYEDAWNRIDESQRKVFLALATATTPIDDKYLNDTCALAVIHNDEFRKALDETHFATLSPYKDHDEIQIVDVAKTFFERRLGKLPELERDEIKSIKDQADKQANTRHRIAQSYKGDRVVDAFRSDFAKAAKNAANRCDFKTAESYYDLALEDDPMNSSLHDRFAWFLLHNIQNPYRAKELALKATDLDTNNADAYLTLALCHYRLNDLESGDKSINRAQKLGKPESLCTLRKGISRYHAANTGSTSREVKLKLLSEGLSLLKKSISSSMNEEDYPHKSHNIREARKYTEMTFGKIGTLKRRE